MHEKQDTGTEQMWTHYLQTCTYAYNNFASLALEILETETIPQEGTDGSFKKYYKLLRWIFQRILLVT